ncbi:MAG TPA: hypothetical protein DCL77_14320 [Prolixibacteraceae bacterium]|jgi:hypothetical protein|nr:hypothetical protein [Prolixibacteraceae bacterium]
MKKKEIIPTIQSLINYNREDIENHLKNHPITPIWAFPTCDTPNEALQKQRLALMKKEMPFEKFKIKMLNQHEITLINDPNTQSLTKPGTHFPID